MSIRDIELAAAARIEQAADPLRSISAKIAAVKRGMAGKRGKALKEAKEKLADLEEQREKIRRKREKEKKAATKKAAEKSPAKKDGYDSTEDPRSNNYTGHLRKKGKNGPSNSAWPGTKKKGPSPNRPHVAEEDDYDSTEDPRSNNYSGHLRKKGSGGDKKGKSGSSNSAWPGTKKKGPSPNRTPVVEKDDYDPTEDPRNPKYMGHLRKGSGGKKRS